MSRIVVTGVTGQVGHELASLLARHGEVIAVDRQRLDLAADPATLREQLEALEPDLIVNPAAHTAVDKAESEPELAEAINARGPAVLAAVAARRRVALIHFSTDYVFDGQGRTPYREDDPVAPASAYGRSKLAGERAVAASGAHHYVLRTSWVYGLRGRNFLVTMARLACERPELRVVDDQVGAPTSARAIAHGTEALVEQILRGAAPRPGVYHMSCAGQTTWCGFARAIVRRLPEIAPLLGLSAPATSPAVTAITTADYPTPARRPAYSVLANEKLLHEAGIALPAWEHALDDVIAAARR